MTSVRERVLSLIWSFAALTWCASSFAFVDPPILVPPNANVGEEVGVQLRSGICDAFIDDPLFDYPQIIRTGNHIRLVMFSVHYDDPIQCFFEPFTFVTPLGEFEAGEYVIQVDRVYPSFFGGLTTETLGELTLVVGGGTPAPSQLPVDSPFALVLLVVFVIFIATRNIQKSKKAIVLSATILCTPMLLERKAHAEDVGEIRLIELLVSLEPGSPTPDQMIQYSSHGGVG